MRVANSLKHLSLSHIWWRSSVETCGGSDQQVWGCSQPDSKTQADMLPLASATLQPQAWLFPGRPRFLNRSPIDPNVWIPGLRRILLIRPKTFCTMVAAKRRRGGVVGNGAPSGSSAASSSSSSTAVQSPSAAAITCSMPSCMKEMLQTKLFSISVASQRHQTAIQSYLYDQGESNTAVK